MSPAELAIHIRRLHKTSSCFDDTSLLADDEAMRLNEPAKRLLDEAGVPLHLIPVAEGGQLSNMQNLMLVLRAVCAKDMSFGLGYILTTFMAATNLWIAGNPIQRDMFSSLLRQGKKIAIAYHELAHGNDLNANELTAQVVQGGFILNGRKEVINNAALSSAVVLYARTGETYDTASHSLFFVWLDPLPIGCRILSRFRTHGARTCHITGFEFSNCFVPSACLMGNIGSGFTHASKAFQLTRAVLPGVSLGVVDHALGMTVRYSATRKLYGGTVLDIPYVRAVLAEIFLELCIADRLTRAMSACIHLFPAQMSVYGALCKYIVPRRMMHALRQLSTVLGAAGYVCTGTTGLFEKILRDYPVLSLGHASSRTCEAIVAAQLGPILKRQPSEPDPNVISHVYRTFEAGPLEPRALRVASMQADPLLASTKLWPEKLRERLNGGQLKQNQFVLLNEIAGNLTSAIEDLKVMEIGANAPHIGHIVERYALLHCGVALLNAWIYAEHEETSLSCEIVTGGLGMIDAHLHRRPFVLDLGLEEKIISHLLAKSMNSEPVI